jgi:magnesium-transporting ATPase (P-type)
MPSSLAVNGLSTLESKQLLLKYGPNTLTTSSNRTFVDIFISQINNWLMGLLVAASIVAYFLGEKIDTLVILAIVLLSVMLGFFQEYHAEKTAQKLKKLITHTARVLRNGAWEEIDSTEIVPGDVVALRIGDRVSADINLIETHELTIDESILTGESVPAEKDTKVHKQAYEGTYVSSGTGMGIVYATGKNTQIGKTVISLSTKEPQTDFQKQIRHFSSFCLDYLQPARTESLYK